MDKRKVLVIGAKRYSFQNDQREQVEGTKVHYLDLEPTTEKDVSGIIPATINLPYGDFSKFPKLPAVFELEFGVQLRGNKPIVKVIGIEYVSQADYAV